MQAETRETEPNCFSLLKKRVRSPSRFSSEWVRRQTRGSKRDSVRLCADVSAGVFGVSVYCARPRQVGVLSRKKPRFRALPALTQFGFEFQELQFAYF